MDQAGLDGHTVCHQNPLPAHSSRTFSWVFSSVDSFVLVLILIFATLAGGQGSNGIRTRGEPIGFHPFTEGNRRNYYRESSVFLNLRRWHGIIYYPLFVEPLQVS